MRKSIALLRKNAELKLKTTGSHALFCQEVEVYKFKTLSYFTNSFIGYVKMKMKIAYIKTCTPLHLLIKVQALNKQ